MKKKDADTASGVDVIVIRGIDAFIEKNDRPDLFEPNEGFYHFPCGECKSNNREQSYCMGCRHYVV